MHNLIFTLATFEQSYYGRTENQRFALKYWNVTNTKSNWLRATETNWEPIRKHSVTHTHTNTHIERNRKRSTTEKKNKTQKSRLKYKKTRQNKQIWREKTTPNCYAMIFVLLIYSCYFGVCRAIFFKCLHKPKNKTIKTGKLNALIPMTIWYLTKITKYWICDADIVCVIWFDNMQAPKKRLHLFVELKQTHKSSEI